MKKRMKKKRMRQWSSGKFLVLLFISVSCSGSTSPLCSSNSEGEGDEEMQEEEEEEEEEVVAKEKKLKAKKVVKPLSKAQLKEFQDEKDRTGMIYLSRIPPYMKPQKVRHIFSQMGDVDRIYLAPEGLFLASWCCSCFIALLGTHSFLAD